MNHSPVVISSGSSNPGSTAETVRPHRGERLDRRGDGCGDLRVDVGVPERRRVGDAETGDTAVEPFQVVGAVRWQRRPVTGVGTLEHVHHQRRVGHAHRVRAEVRHRAERRQRMCRHPSEARLEPDVAAERGRDAHRPGTVGADAERPAPGGHGGRRPARRTAGGPCGSHGLRVIPVRAELVSPLQPNSGVVVLPMSTAPASRSRAVAGASTSHACSGSTVRLPRRVGHPRVRMRSLIDTGTPSSGPTGSPRAHLASLAAAAASASSAATRQKALIVGPTRSMRSSTARVASTGDAAPLRYSSSSSVAVHRVRSVVTCPSWPSDGREVTRREIG